jgi:outer membrane protein
MEQWVASAEDQNFAVRVQQATLEIASREIERARAGHYPTLNMVGSYGKNSASISTIGTVSVGTDSTSRTIGLQLAIPLYAGGSVNSLVRQAKANEEKARQDLESARRSAALAVRQAYLGVTNGMAQVRALEQALVSSQSALDSNKLGYEVGVRINIDVLNAQQQVFSTMRDLAKARYDTLVNGLKLKAAAGTLAEADLETVNRLLGTN